MKYSSLVLPLLDFPALEASVGVGVPGVLADLDAAARVSALVKHVRRRMIMAMMFLMLIMCLQTEIN